MTNNTPLIVDLDHTLINTDLLYQSSIRTLKRKPWLVFIYPFWFLRGKGYLKDQLIKHCEIDVSKLTYINKTLNYIEQRKQQGSPIVLATASHQFYAHQVAEYLGVFDDVMASDASFNLSSHNKADKLIERYGKGEFDYIGDHMRDLPVWEASNLSILVNVSDKVIRHTQHLRTLRL